MHAHVPRRRYGAGVCVHAANERVDSPCVACAGLLVVGGTCACPLSYAYCLMRAPHADANMYHPCGPGTHTALLPTASMHE